MPRPRIAPSLPSRTFQGTISEDDLPTLAAKYELDPPQVAAVVASMWAKHLDRPLTARKKKRELKPNSRYDQDSIANAEAGEEEEEEQVEAEVTPMDEEPHTPRGTKHLDDDDEDVSYDEKTGISAEVRVQVTCGDMRGTAVLPAGYKKQQEYVLHSDGKKVPPSQFERDAGKGSCKNWKNSVMVVMPDGVGGADVSGVDGEQRVLPGGYQVGRVGGERGEGPDGAAKKSDELDWSFPRGQDATRR